MQIRRTVPDVRTVAGDRPGLPALRLRWTPGLLALLIALTIAGWAFVYGGQPVFGDGQGYFDYGQLVATVGPKAFVSQIRTYGYPYFLAGIMRVVGQDVEDVQAATFLVQLGLLIAACWIGARRLEGALGTDGIGQVIFAVTVANPFLLIASVQVLTDLPAAVLAYLGIVLSLPQRRPEPAGRVAVLAAGALLCTGLAVMLRPTNLLMPGVVACIWIARAVISRDVPWTVLPLGLAAFVLPFVPQAWSNYRAFGVPHPLVVASGVYWDNVLWGLMYLKYVTLFIPDVTNSVYYENPFWPPGTTVGEMVREHPAAYLATLAVHAFATVDQDFPFTFVREVDPWYRWPLSLLNYLFLLGAGVGMVLGLRGTAGQPKDALLRQRVTLLAFGLAGLAFWAVHLPTKPESRYALPLYLLMAPPFALAAVWLAAALPTAGARRLTLGALAVAVWVGLCAAASIWIQNQAPVLVALRGGGSGAVASARPATARPRRPSPPPARRRRPGPSRRPPPRATSSISRARWPSAPGCRSTSPSPTPGPRPGPSTAPVRSTSRPASSPRGPSYTSRSRA